MCFGIISLNKFDNDFSTGLSSDFGFGDSGEYGLGGAFRSFLEEVALVREVDNMLSNRVLPNKREETLGILLWTTEG